MFHIFFSTSNKHAQIPKISTNIKKEIATLLVEKCQYFGHMSHFTQSLNQFINLGNCVELLPRF